jgi:hypothetical protein
MVRHQSNVGRNMGSISPEQLDRIAERAGDVGRRTYGSGVEANAKPVDFGQLTDDLKRHGAPGTGGLLSAFGRVAGMLGSVGGAVAMGPDGPVRFGGKAPSATLPEPPDEARLAAAENRIGRLLPQELRQLYSIADGGFGPGDGLFPLKEMVSRYVEMTCEPFGPLGQPWPSNLLPIFEEDPVLLCLDLDTGGMMAWDPEEIEDDESDADWKRSFKAEAPSLAALMDKWLGAPTLEEDTAAMLSKAKADYLAKPRSPVTGFPMELEPSDQAEGEITFLAHSEALRKDFGLPETGWEDEIRRRHGLL